MISRAARIVLPLVAALSSSACASPPPPSPAVPVAPPPVIETEPPPPPPPAPKKRDALARIREAVGTRMWLLADFEAIHEHDASSELGAALFWRTPLHMLPGLMEATKRMLLTARSGEVTPHWAVAAEHDLETEALETLFVRLRRMCENVPAEGMPLRVKCGSRVPVLVAAPTPTLVVVVRPEHEDVLVALTDSAGLPAPKAAFEAHVEAPRETFRGRRMPEVPATIAKGYGELRLLPDGGATLLLEGTSSSATQAQADAEELHRIVDTLDLPGPDVVKNALRRMLRFEVEGEKVRLQKELSLAQIRLFMLLVDEMVERPRARDSIGGP